MLNPIRWLMGKFSIDMGIDLGTANTLVYVKDEGVVLSEPSVVAVQRGTTEVLLGGEAVGNRAKEMLGRTPANVVAIRPLKAGTITSFDITEKMLRYFIQRVHNRHHWVKPQVVISVSSGITAVERRAVISSAERAGARKVYLVDQPTAAAIGAGLPVTEPQGCMVVDIGGGTTEVAVLSLGGVVQSQCVRAAGDDFDQAIIRFLKDEHGLVIGPQMAEKIKINIGSVAPMEQEYSMAVRGREVMNGLPRETTVTSDQVREALQGPVREIVEAIKATLEKTPPEISADLVERGILLCGGGALLKGIDRVIHEETQLQVTVADEPLSCVVEGTGIFLENLDLLEGVLNQEEEMG